MRLNTLAALFVAALACLPAAAGQYTNFNVAIYIPVGTVQTFKDPARLASDWERISRQLKVDKVYIEVQRNRQLASDDLLENVKKFFASHGVQTAGGMALSDEGGGGQFRSFCYTDPKDRAFIQRAVELAARHFDEIIQDDFFFITTKNDSDIAAKGDKSWTRFRLDLASEAAESLLIKPAKAVNPRVKMVIKFPNWYEHFQGLGYDLEREPKLFDGIYTGTETRDPETTDQNLQQYESYLIYRYFENIKPGRNGGGWVDTFNIRYVDRYSEQLWDTMFAKAPEMMLFAWAGMLQPFRAGNRGAWASLPTSFDADAILASFRSNAPAGLTNPTMALAAGRALEQADAVVGHLGIPIGIASYRPYHSTGEDFLHNYIGNLGIPIDLHPEFPTNSGLVLLTECAKADPAVVSKIKQHLAGGGSVVITSGLLRALQGKGIEDILEVEYTDRKILTHEFSTGFGSGDFGAVENAVGNADMLIQDIRFLTNDSWVLARAMAGGKGYPLLLMNRYSKGVIYVWTIPDNFNDLYRLPPRTMTAIKNQLMRGFPVRIDAPAQVALFAYDNHSFIVESYLPVETEVRIRVAGESHGLKNLLTGETAAGRSAGGNSTEFTVRILPHSYQVFATD
ncbi:MAG: hypothetical protein U1F98_02540 [Verrucomicrobiota bacterium]